MRAEYCGVTELTGNEVKLGLDGAPATREVDGSSLAGIEEWQRPGQR